VRVRVNVWSPLPPSASGIADYVAEQLPALARHLDVTAVGPESSEPAEADLDLYQLGNSAAHAFVYRAALRRPGVVLLHDWSLHHLVLAETLEQGDRTTYLREMRRSYGEAGSFVGRQIARGLGGALLPALYPLNDRILESSLAVVGLSRFVAARAALRLCGRPVLQLPHHLWLALDPPPSRDEARGALGLPRDALLVTAPGLATASKRLDVAMRAVARLRAKHNSLRLVIAGGVDQQLPLAAWARDAGLGDGLVLTGRLSPEDFVRHIAAADVVLALRFPTHGEMSGALVRTLGVGRPAFVTAGTPAAEEFPEGIVVPVDPGLAEEAHLSALLERLLGDGVLRDTVGRLARAHVLEHNGLEATVRRLAGFLSDVSLRREELVAAVAPFRPKGDSLEAYLLDELRFGAHDLGLAGVSLGFEALVASLAQGRS
jgi:glycosyltransferase involved in cell wall biosynthesis